MRVIFGGRKNLGVEALDLLLARKWDVLPMVAQPEPAWMPPPHFEPTLRARGIPMTTQAELLKALAGKPADAVAARFVAEPVDLLLCFLYPPRVKPPLLRLPRIAAINFHPAPLPEYGGLAGYNLAILDKKPTYGATAFHMTPEFDTGDIVLRLDFPFDHASATAFDLEQLTRPCMLDLFAQVVGMVESGEPLPRKPQNYIAYTNKEQFEAMKRIDLSEDSAERIEAKARAFWYPPYEGAYFERDGRRFTVVPTCKLGDIGRVSHAPTA
jgi:methionyl-tRNA formyltransferase